MRTIAPLPLSPPAAPPRPVIFTNGYRSTAITAASSWVQKALVKTITGAISVNLLFSSPPSLSLQSSSVQPKGPPPSSAEFCLQEQEEEVKAESDSQIVTNEGIVEEAWQIVNDSFLDSGSRRRWSPEVWQRKREDVLSSLIQSRSKAHDIIRRMLSSLGDPYTRFLSPSDFSKMARYDMSGVGINLKEVPDENGGVKLKVLGLLLDGPAHSVGVRQVVSKPKLWMPDYNGDEVLAVNGEDIRGKSAFEVSSLLQGPNETIVTIKVKHGNCGPIQSLEVQRQLVARTPVFYRLEQIENGITSVGYVRLKEFNALARKDLVIAMKRLQDMGASYFILDLRDNLGGLVQAGIEIAKLFLDKGETIIYTVGRDPQYQNVIVADTAPLVTKPVIVVLISSEGLSPTLMDEVLVNNKTASASEIVASALHDNCRAVLVGERTFGKGLIQSVFELHDGSGVVVTVGKYVTPNHMDINGNGIEPDYRNIPAWSDVVHHLADCKLHQRG